MRHERSSIIYLATHNPHKVAEISAVIGSSWNLCSLAEVNPPIKWEETGTTFLENAMIKVQAVYQALGGPVLGEDSGLEVTALHGAPGVYSSSYGGVEGDQQRNRLKLLDALQGVPPERRGARFVCTLVYVDAQGVFSTFVGSCPGEITIAPRGAGGFGYDPLFQPTGYHSTMAEISSAEKVRISHRTQALKQWVARMH